GSRESYCGYVESALFHVQACRLAQQEWVQPRRKIPLLPTEFDHRCLRLPDAAAASQKVGLLEQSQGLGRTVTGFPEQSLCQTTGVQGGVDLPRSALFLGHLQQGHPPPLSVPDLGERGERLGQQIESPPPFVPRP